ncbi:MAG TPA: class I SAM-dependent methyltransferase [Gemmatimonadales bacterium]|jgi:SAM-dependent methyltransferase|nr:class I SAM-dependent methyltransferase [Gemmatimonadales bacterium]
MLSQTTDASFAGSLPAFYQQYLVPLIFEPYAADLARRLARRPLRRVLEIAAGTGVVTRRLASTLPESVAIVATDLNQAMLDQAAATGTSRPVEWRQADASALPFPDQSVDAVVCQFGVMFFPDKPRAFAEARRVLRPAGVFLFNVWDRIEDNEFADVITAELATLYPDDPPRFLTRTPHGYADRATIERDLSAAGFGSPAEFVTLAGPSRADSADIPALAYCHGTPLRNEIEARDPHGLTPATARAAEAIRRRFGAGAVEGKVQAHVIAVEK